VNDISIKVLADLSGIYRVGSGVRRTVKSRGGQYEIERQASQLPCRLRWISFVEIAVDIALIPVIVRVQREALIDKGGALCEMIPANADTNVLASATNLKIPLSCV